MWVEGGAEELSAVLQESRDYYLAEATYNYGKMTIDGTILVLFLFFFFGPNRHLDLYDSKFEQFR